MQLIQKNKERDNMVTMWVKLDDESLKRSKYTRPEMEKMIRDFFRKKNGVEVAPLTFQRDDELAVGAFANFFALMMHDADFMAALAECRWDIDGEVENCLAEVKDAMDNIKM
jgi:hypothetical protein